MTYFAEETAHIQFIILIILRFLSLDVFFPFFYFHHLQS